MMGQRLSTTPLHYSIMYIVCFVSDRDNSPLFTRPIRWTYNFLTEYPTGTETVINRHSNTIQYPSGTQENKNGWSVQTLSN